MTQRSVTNASVRDAANSTSYLTFKSGSASFALNVNSVRYITSAAAIKTREAPDDKKRMHQIFDFDGQATELYHFCDIIGSSSQQQEVTDLLALLSLRKQDHIAWINALEHSLQTGEPFTKATDPHKCAFGLWYDHYIPLDAELAAIMVRFNAPHQRIHSLAEQLLTMAKAPERVAEALAILQSEKLSTFKELLTIFEMATSRLQDMLKPVIIILASEYSNFAIELDNIGDIRPFSESDWLPDIKNHNENLSCYDGFFQTGDHQLFLKINPQKIRHVIEYKWRESTLAERKAS